jgi:hypothetical protein
MVVSMHRQPLRRTSSDVNSDVEPIPILDHMEILNAETIATSQARTGVVSIADILDDDRQVASSFENQSLQKVFPMRSQKTGEIRRQRTLVLRIGLILLRSALAEFVETVVSHNSVLLACFAGTFSNHVRGRSPPVRAATRREFLQSRGSLAKQRVQFNQQSCSSTANLSVIVGQEVQKVRIDNRRVS